MISSAESIVRRDYCPLSKNGGKDGSETSFIVNFIALVITVAFLVFAYRLGIHSPAELFVIIPISALVLTVALELLFFSHARSRFNFKFVRRLSLKRVFLREVALIATLGAIALCYWLFPVFDTKATRTCYYPFLGFLVPAILLLSFPYFCLMDRIDQEEEDEYCKLGRAILSFRKTMTRFEFGNYVRSWLVKAFWLSLMQPEMVEKIKVFIAYDWGTTIKGLNGPATVVILASTICYGIDLFYASCGYILNFKLFHSHTRTAEPTLLGWICTLACYWPFFAILVSPYFLPYSGTKNWMSVFDTGGILWYSWAVAIVLLEFIYSMSTVAAGIRFSNLTYRGLWNTGPYRLTKHPAYVAKNLAWWLISVPFLVNSGGMAIKCSILLFCLNIVYFIRAKTEERHLSHYPEYVAYALAMNNKSLFRWCAKLIPYLKYSAPDSDKAIFKVK